MIYGMYLSASGIVANSYRQDVISNNLANAETNGFKRDLATFYERPTEAATRGLGGDCTNPMLELLGGGILAMPTLVDSGQGDLESTGNNLDVAIQGKGFFTVSDGKSTKLTRDGKFNIDSEGLLSLASAPGQHVLDSDGQPIPVDIRKQTTIAEDGVIVQNGKPVNKIGVFDVPNPRDLTKLGGQMMSVPDMKKLVPSAATLRSEFLERANVDPASELSQLMETQRQLEANANMIRYQDQMLDKLVNQVGKIS
ncbi:MAG TPA: flagellar hook-basal body protein [Roseimicrobium sp.]|nr:flagellar hook-basal body protein [Roseimicrobium sp.]